MLNILLKATGIWLIIVIAAIINGVIREKLMVPMVGLETALPLSGITLSIFILLISFTSVSFIGAKETKTFLAIGVLWLVLTLSFEFLFGHYVVGKPWEEIIQVFSMKKGDLFIVVLFVTVISPWVTAKIRGIGV